MKIIYKTITGLDIKNFIEVLSTFREKAFSLPPYSYCFDQKEEDKYLDSYIKNPLSCLICAIKNEKIIGVISGMPLTSTAEITKNAEESFKKNQLKPTVFFYICEVIVLESHRKKHIGEALMKNIEAHACSIGMSNLCLLTIEKSSKKRNLWGRLGYSETDIIEKYSWPTHLDQNTVKTKEHQLTYWIKKNDCPPIQ